MHARKLAASLGVIALVAAGSLGLAASANADEIAPPAATEVAPSPDTTANTPTSPSPTPDIIAPTTTTTTDIPVSPVTTSPAVAARVIAPTPEVTVSPYVLAIWRYDTEGVKFPQALVASEVTGGTDVHALDASATLCGTTYQSDLYANDDATTTLIASGVLNGGEESWPSGSYESSDSNTFTTAACVVTPPPTVPACTTTTSGGVSTNLDANGWTFTDTRATGHNDYVAGGLHVYTESNTSTDKAAGYHALGVPLAAIGVPSIDADVTVSTGAGLQLVLDGFNIVNEGSIYGAGEYWSNHAFAGVPAGGGYASLGTLDQYLQGDPTGVVSYVGYSLGSGVHGDEVIHSITAGCKVFTFDHADAPLPVVSILPVTTTPATCTSAATYTVPVQPTGVKYALAVPTDPTSARPVAGTFSVADGVSLTIVAHSITGYVPVSYTTTVTGHAALADASCSPVVTTTAPPVVTDQLVTPHALAFTGETQGASDARSMLVLVGLGLLVLGALAIIAVSITAAVRIWRERELAE